MADAGPFNCFACLGQVSEVLSCKSGCNVQVGMGLVSRVVEVCVLVIGVLFVGMFLTSGDALCMWASVVDISVLYRLPSSFKL